MNRHADDADGDGGGGGGGAPGVDLAVTPDDVLEMIGGTDGPTAAAFLRLIGSYEERMEQCATREITLLEEIRHLRRWVSQLRVRVGDPAREHKKAAAAAVAVAVTPLQPQPPAAAPSSATEALLAYCVASGKPAAVYNEVQVTQDAPERQWHYEAVFNGKRYMTNRPAGADHEARNEAALAVLSSLAARDPAAAHALDIVQGRVPPSPPSPPPLPEPQAQAQAQAQPSPPSQPRPRLIQMRPAHDVHSFDLDLDAGADEPSLNSLLEAISRQPPAPAPAPVGHKPYVSQLKELLEKFRLPAPEYDYFQNPDTPDHIPEHGCTISILLRDAEPLKYSSRGMFPRRAEAKEDVSEFALRALMKDPMIGGIRRRY